MGMTKQLLIVGLLLVAFGCQNRPAQERAFYHWKTNVLLTEAEEAALRQLGVQYLYVHCFDVVWNADTKRPQPIALARFGPGLPKLFKWIPVVFITNETLAQLSADEAHDLALHIDQLLASLWAENALPEPQEIQLDCDWNASTQPIYFKLLSTLKSRAFFKGKQLSATIRLHQIKYKAATGVPPVDKGLLMAYNMGKLTEIGTKNSIVDTEVLQQYLGQLHSYPLTLDVGLPIFDWWVWFRAGRFAGLIQGDALPPAFKTVHYTKINADTLVNGYTFRAGDVVRYEAAEPATLMACADLLRKKLHLAPRKIVLYHLHPKNLARYELSTLEALFQRFH
jgi:hypothetical protein